MYLLFQPSNHLDLPSGSVKMTELLIFHIHNNIFKMFTPTSLHNKLLCHPGGRSRNKMGVICIYCNHQTTATRSGSIATSERAEFPKREN